MKQVLEGTGTGNEESEIHLRDLFKDVTIVYPARRETEARLEKGTMSGGHFGFSILEREHVEIASYSFVLL